jgi:D-arabinose 1-dehydrogenase-like Zn-dependent alcohol dehydrogenase
VGWPSGSSVDSQDTLHFSLLTGVRAMSEIFPLDPTAEAYEHMMSGKARFRGSHHRDFNQAQKASVRGS